MKHPAIDIVATALMALVLATLIWYYASSQVIEQETFQDVPLEVRAPKDISAQPNIKGFEKLVVQGTRANLDKLNQRSIVSFFTLTREYLDNLDATQERSFNVTSEWFNLVEGVRMLEVSPAVVMVKLSPIVVKKLRVAEPEIIGKLVPGMAVKKIILTPPEVEVKGPTDLFDKGGVTQIETFPLHIGSRMSSFTTMARLKREIGEVLLSAPETVIADVVIGREDAKKVFRNLPIGFMVTSQAGRLLPLRIDPPTVPELTMLGPAEHLDKLKPQDVKPFVEITDDDLAELLRGNQRKVELKCFWPRLPEVRPVWEQLSVTVDTKREPTATRPR